MGRLHRSSSSALVLAVMLAGCANLGADVEVVPVFPAGSRWDTDKGALVVAETRIFAGHPVELGGGWALTAPPSDTLPEACRDRAAYWFVPDVPRTAPSGGS